MDDLSVGNNLAFSAPMTESQVAAAYSSAAGSTGFLTMTSGTRFGIYEHGYTRLNSAVNFLDIDEGRPENVQRVRVIDLSSGDEVSRFEWDPRSRSIKPAIAPDGHHIVRVKGGVLEVLQVN